MSDDIIPEGEEFPAGIVFRDGSGNEKQKQDGKDTQARDQLGFGLAQAEMGDQKLDHDTAQEVVHKLEQGIEDVDGQCDGSENEQTRKKRFSDFIPHHSFSLGTTIYTFSSFFAIPPSSRAIFSTRSGPGSERAFFFFSSSVILASSA